ncbi:MAG: HlyD family efflux transporter periplasmic adaptor subunit [Pseudomonadota bacterium]
MDRPLPDAALRRRQRRGRLHKAVAAAAAAAALVFAVFSAVTLLSARHTATAATQTVETVERGSLRWEVAAAGSLHPANTRVVPAPVNGSVVAVHREVGDALVAGTPIVTLDNLSERRRLLEAEQELRAAEAALVELRGDRRTRELEHEQRRQEMIFELSDARRRAEASAALPEGVLPAIDVLRLGERVASLTTLLEVERRRAQAELDAAEARIEQQRARVEQLDRLREFQQDVVASLEIKSPVAGVLKSLPIETGQRLNEGAVIADIVEPGELVARLRVPESAAASLRLGLPATLNARGIALDGQVSRVAPAVTDGTIIVDVALAQRPEALRTALSVQGFIELDRLDDVMHLTRPVGVAEHAVVRLERLNADGRAEPVSVRFGRSTGGRIHILDGVAEGDRIVVSAAPPDTRTARFEPAP